MSETTLTWLGHCDLPLRHARAEAHLHRPVPATGIRSAPRASSTPERVDVIAHHARPRRPRRRHRRPREEARLHRRRAGRARPTGCGKQGVENVLDPNKGGTVEAAGVKFTLTNAHHSSSNNDLEYMGEPCGIVVTIEDGPKLYFAGDTCVFGDMADCIGRLYAPDVAILPIGGHYTMGPQGGRARPRAARREALRALPLRHVPAAQRGRRRSCASSRRTSRSRSWSPETRSRYEGALVGRERPARAGARGRGRPRGAGRRGARPRRRRRPGADRARRSTRARRSSSAPRRPRRCARRSRGPRWRPCSCPTDRRDLLELDLTELTYG